MWRLCIIFPNPGQVFSINTEAVFPYKPQRYGQFGDGGKTKMIQMIQTNYPRAKVLTPNKTLTALNGSILKSAVAPWTGFNILIKQSNKSLTQQNSHNGVDFPNSSNRPLKLIRT